MTAKAITAASAGSRTGLIQRLTDPDPADQIARLTDKAKQDPAFATKWLKDHGYITPKGNVPRRFGGR